MLYNPTNPFSLDEVGQAGRCGLPVVFVGIIHAQLAEYRQCSIPILTEYGQSSTGRTVLCPAALDSHGLYNRRLSAR